MAEKLYPSKIGAPGSINAYTLNGSFVPANTHFILRDSDLLHFHIGAIEYKSPTGTSTGAAPRQYSGINTGIRRLDNGTETADNTAFNDVVQGMVIADIAGFIGTATAVSSTTLTDATANWPTNIFASRTVHMGGQYGTISSNTATVITVASWTSSTPTIGAYTIDSAGTPYLVVGFGSSTNPRIAYRDLSTDTTPWTTQTGATYAQFWLITRLGGAGYAAVTDAGVAVLGEWRMSIAPLGNDIRLASSWGNGLEIGGPEWAITGLSAIGNSPVVGKPDGLYFYDLQTRRYENVLKHYELVPHPLNGKVTQAVTGGIVYTTFNGEAYFFDGTAVQEISPKKLWKQLGKDVGNSRITAIADRGDFIDMAMDTGHQSTQNAGLVINKVTAAGAATDITANAVDGNFATGADVSNLAATSFIDVWANIPFVGVIFHVTRQSNSTATAVFGSLSYSSANNTFTAYSGFKDGTRLSSNGSLSYVSFPPSASAGLIQPTDVNASTLQQAVNFTYASGGTNVTAKYGMRVAMSGAAFDAATEIDEIEIIPTRAGMPNGGIYSATTNFTAKDGAQMMTRIVSLKRERTTGFTPHDSYCLDTFGGVQAMAVHVGRLGQASGAQNLGQSLIVHGRYRTVGVSCGVTGDPSRDLYPITVQPSTSKAGPLWQIMYDWDGDDATQTKHLKWVAIDTRYLQPTDAWEVFCQHDGQDIVAVGRGTGGPIAFTPSQAPFRYMNMWLAVNRAATTNERAPQFLEPVNVEYTVIGDPASWPRDRADQIPSAV